MTVPVTWLPPVLLMQTGVNAVAAGGPAAGWVSGTPANLADGATETTVFDLGPQWERYVLVQIIVYSTVATSLDTIYVTGSDTPAHNWARRLKELSHAATSVALGSATYVVTAIGAGLFRPMGRYVVLRYTNTAAGGAQGSASAVNLAAYPA